MLLFPVTHNLLSKTCFDSPAEGALAGYSSSQLFYLQDPGYFAAPAGYVCRHAPVHFAVRGPNNEFSQSAGGCQDWQGQLTKNVLHPVTQPPLGDQDAFLIQKGGEASELLVSNFLLQSAGI